jgi:hypothetical protein
MAQEEVNAVVMIQVDPTGEIHTIKGDIGPNGRYTALDRAKMTLFSLERERVIRQLLNAFPGLDEVEVRAAVEPK